MPTRRGTSNSNSRGSSSDRRRRKIWLLVTFGDGEKTECSFEECTEILTFETITVDRYPIPGCEGGKYTQGNIRPSCAFHNSQDGSYIAQRRREKSLKQ